MRRVIALLAVTSIIVLLLSVSAVCSQTDPATQKISRDLRVQMLERPGDDITVLVQLKEEDDLDEVASSLMEKGGIIIGKHRIGDVIVVDIPADRIRDIARDSSVKTISPNRVYRALLQDSVPQINAPVMWDVGYTGTGVRIAIFDTGIDPEHPALRERVVLNRTFTGEGHAYDVYGHGTHCAGIAAGVAPDALLINAKVLNDTGYGDDIGIIEALNWAVDPDGDAATDDGAGVISMSLGSPYSDLDSPMLSAIGDAVDAGVVVVVAVGNCGSGCPGSSCNGYVGVATPGNSPDAISVGAVDNSDYWACFSSGGYVNGTIKPDVVAPGMNINSSVPGGGYASNSGTSMAAPHVAGAVAMLLQSNPGLTPVDVKYIVEHTCRDLGEPGKDVKYGAGLIDAGGFIPPNVNKLLEYRLSFPDAVYRREPVSITVNATFENVARIDGTVTDPDGSVFVLDFTGTTAHLWNSVFAETARLGRYDLSIGIVDLQGNVTELGRDFYVVINPESGIINDITLPEQVTFNDTLPISVVFENIGDSDYEVMLEVQILDDGVLVGSVEGDLRIVGAGSTTAFDLSWVADRHPGTMILRAVASFEGGVSVQEGTFVIHDNDPPILSAATFDERLIVNAPALIEVAVTDLSAVSGNVTVKNPSGAVLVMPLRTLSRTGDLSVLAGTYTGTDGAGDYTFNITVCDSAGFCTSSDQHVFSVTGYVGSHLIVISEQEGSKPERFRETLGDDGCYVSLWDKSVSGIPTLPYIERFDMVIWSTGNYGGDNVDKDSSDLLMNYTKNGGRLVLEGPDIAFGHGHDDFVKNVAHCSFKDDISLSESEISMTVTRNHPIFTGLLHNISFNASASPYPDSVTPSDGGVELAEWSTGGSAIVAFNDNGTKTLFIPFMLDALDSVECLFIRNTVDWMLTDENSADLVIGDISYSYLIEGTNPIDIKVENAGLAGVTDVRIDILVDGVLEETVSVDVPSNDCINLASVLTLEPNMHELKVELNSDCSVVEQNYLNNIETENVRVAALEPDLIPVAVSSDIGDATVDISVRVENVGGNDVDDLSIEFWIDNNLLGRETVNLGYGQTRNVSVGWQKEEGLFDLLIKLNPDRKIVESNYSNNNISGTLYVCSKSSILIIDDCDTEDYSTDEPGSADEFEMVLLKNGYCTVIWNETEKGIPTIEYLNRFDAVIWSAGDYWNTVINESDVALLEQYNGGIIFEGSDITSDHPADPFIQNHLHAYLDRDLILDNEAEVILGTHEILSGIPDIHLNRSRCPYPDSLTPTDGIGVANWQDGGSAIITYNGTGPRTVYYGFSIDSITDPETMERLVVNSVEWVQDRAAMKGDLNNDDRITTTDACIALQIAASGGWDQSADVNEDGIVTSLDVLMILQEAT
jgi:subtilisin family serine protease